MKKLFDWGVFDNWYTGVDICDMIGQRENPGLWVFTLLYIYPGWESPTIFMIFKLSTSELFAISLFT